MATVGNLIVKIGGDLSGFSRAIGQASEKAKGFASSVRKNGAAIAKGFAVATAAVSGVGAALLAAAHRSADFADVIDKTSIRIGISRKTLQEFGFVAGQLGVPFSAIENAIRGFTRNLVSIRTGSSDAAKVFGQLGVSLYDASGQLKRMDTLFPEIIKALSEMKNMSERNATALTILGRGGQAMIPVLDAGADTINMLTRQAREMGLALEDDAIAALVAFKDEMTALNKQLEVDTARVMAKHIDDIAEVEKAWIRLKGQGIELTAGIARFLNTAETFVKLGPSLVGGAGSIAAGFAGIAEQARKARLEAIEWNKLALKTHTTFKAPDRSTSDQSTPAPTRRAVSDLSSIVPIAGASEDVTAKAHELAVAGAELVNQFKAAQRSGQAFRFELREINVDAAQLAEGLAAAGERWEKGFVDKMQKTVPLIQTGLTALGDNVAWFFESIVSGVDDGVSALRKLGAELADTVRAILAAVKAQIIAMAAVSAATKILTGNILGGLKDLAKAAAIVAVISAAEGALSGAIDRLTKPKQAGIPALAAGGIVRRPTLALIGERGPEAVVPLKNAGAMTPEIVFQGNLDVSFSRFHFQYEAWKRNRGL